MITPNRPTGVHAADCLCRACRAHEVTFDLRRDYNVPVTGTHIMRNADHPFMHVR